MAVNQNAGDEEKRMLCVGATFSSDVIAQIKDDPRPTINGVQWITKRNLFIAFHGFLPMKRGTSVDSIKKELGIVAYKYFPIMLKPYQLTLAPNKAVPRSLNWTLVPIGTRQEDINIDRVMRAMSAELEPILKTICNFPMGIEITPHVVLARMDKVSMSEEQKKELVSIPMPEDKFKLDPMVIVEVGRDEFGVKYTYHSIAGVVF